ncbi:MAG TPA: helix-turn-helix transcriptional regulator [Fibrobacteria bacterium]|nr:helix-turn-helix transcriptional regulator [Fibrobacteria bacterium]
MNYTRSGIDLNTLSEFVKERRGQAGLTQQELALKAGVGLRFVRDLEQGKTTLRLDKVNQILGLFGHETGAVRRAKIDRPAADARTPGNRK